MDTVIHPGFKHHQLTNGPLPQLFVFDVDYTLWKAHVDASNGPPFRKDPADSDAAFDCGSPHQPNGARIALFPQARSVLATLHDAGVQLAIASRTSTPDDSLALQSTLDIRKYFTNKQLVQMYPGAKVTHFARLRDASGVDYRHMIFFDDEPRNIADVSKLGVTSILIGRTGLNFDILEEGISLHRKNLEGSSAVMP